MALFTVDSQKCKADGICAAACPMGIIREATPQSVPSVAQEDEYLCLNCGHCMAICPHGALTLHSMPRQQCQRLRPELMPQPEQLGHLLRGRRSIRCFHDEPLGQKLLDRLIDVARYAPSSKNTQPLNWLVIYNAHEVHELAGLVIDWMIRTIEDDPPLAQSLNLGQVVARWQKGLDPICRGAPHLVVVHSAEDDPTAPPAATIALTYLELMAQDTGIGACWAGYFNRAANLWPPLLEALELPTGHISFGAMMLGRPKYKYRLIPSRNPARVVWR